MTKESLKRGRYCKFCNKNINGTSFDYNAHLFTHDAVKPRYVCDVCSRPYFRRDTFSRHMNTHLERGEITTVLFKYNTKGFICDYCDRSFRDKRNLIYHLKVHDDQISFSRRSYKCKACHISYCEERLLKRHIRREHFNLNYKNNIYELKKLNETWLERIHNSKACVEMTKVKPNVISIKKCNVKMENVEIVKKLQNYVQFKDMSQYSKVICDYCKKEMLKKSLITHIKERHFKIRKFLCDTCKRTFKRHYQLVDHDCGKVRSRKRWQSSTKGTQCAPSVANQKFSIV